MKISYLNNNAFVEFFNAYGYLTSVGISFSVSYSFILEYEVWDYQVSSETGTSLLSL